MSAEQATVDATDADAPYLIVAAGKGNTKKTVHLPSADSTRDAPATVCPRGDEVPNLLVKDPAVYPPGYRRVCKLCLAGRRA